MDKNKISALKEANLFISRKLKSLDFSLNGRTKYNRELLYQSSNSETSINIFSIKGGQKSQPFIENEFQRIVCLEGELKIVLVDGSYNEQFRLKSSNTILIPPHTKYVVESIADSEILVVFKPRKEIFEKILTEKTIYNKI